MFAFGIVQIVHMFFLLFMFGAVFLSSSSIIECRTVPVKQVLPPKPGYIPVYIQHGDSPPDVSSLYKSSMPLNHKNVSKQSQKYKNNVYQSGHFMSLNRLKPNQPRPQSKYSQAVLYHKAAAGKDGEYYRAKVASGGKTRMRRFLDFWRNLS